MSAATRTVGLPLLLSGLYVAVATHCLAQALMDAPMAWVEDTAWRGHRGTINTVAVSADGLLVVTGDSDGAVRLWRVPEGKSRLYRGHSGAVLDVAVDPQGRFAVSASADKTARVWRLDRREEVTVIEGSRGAVTCVAVSSDSEFIITGGSDSALRVWDASTGNRVRSLNTRPAAPKAIHDILLSADGQRVFIAGGPFGDTHRAIYAFHVDTTANMGWPYVTAPWEAVEAALAASSDGTTVALGGLAGVVTLWTPSNLARRLTGHEGAVLGVAVRNDGSLVASAGQDGTVRIWSTRSTGDPHVLEAHRGSVNDVAFGPAGDWLMSVGDDRTVRRWLRVTDSDPPGAQPRAHEPASDGEAVGGSFDGDLAAALATAADVLALAAPQDEFETTAAYTDRLALHNARLSEIRAMEGRTFEVALAVDEVGRYDPDAQRLAMVVSRDGLLAPAAASVTVPRTLARQVKRDLNRVWATAHVRVSQPALQAAVHLSRVRASIGGRRVDVDTHNAWTPGFLLVGDEGHIRDLAATRDGELLASCGWGGSVRIWRVADGARRGHYSHNTYDARGRLVVAATVAATAWSPDGSTLVAGSLGRAISVWSRDTVTRLEDLWTEGELAGHFVMNVAWSPDGALLATTRNDGSLHVFDVRANRIIASATLGSAVGGGASALAFLPNDALLVSTVSGPLERWVLDRRAGIVRLGGIVSRMPAHGFAALGEGAIVASHADGFRRIWDIGRGGSRAFGSKPRVFGLATHPDSQIVAGAAGHWSIPIWDATTRELLQHLNPPEEAALPAGTARLTFASADVLAASMGGDIRLWWRVGAQLSPTQLRPLEAAAPTAQ